MASACLKLDLRPRECHARTLRNEVLALEHQRVGRRIDRLVGARRRVEPELQSLRDQARDFVLDGENVLEIARECVGPQMKPVRRLDELRRDPHTLACSADAAFDDMSHAQLPRDLGDRCVLALEVKGRGSRRNLEPGHLGEQIEQLLTNAVGKVFVLFVGAQVGEGEHGDRLLGRDGRRNDVLLRGCYRCLVPLQQIPQSLRKRARCRAAG